MQIKCGFPWIYLHNCNFTLSHRNPQKVCKKGASCGGKSSSHQLYADITIIISLSRTPIIKTKLSEPIGVWDSEKQQDVIYHCICRTSWWELLSISGIKDRWRHFMC